MRSGELKEGNRNGFEFLSESTSQPVTFTFFLLLVKVGQVLTISNFQFLRRKPEQSIISPSEAPCSDLTVVCVAGERWLVLEMALQVAEEG